MPGTLDDKVAMVTGGGSGIGRASSLAFSREGAKVVVSDVNASGAEETVGLIKDAGGQAVFIHADVTRAADVEALVQGTVREFGNLDCAFNNAGVVGTRTLLHECSEEDWNRVIDINLKGVWLCLKYEIIRMLEQGNGTIVNSASIMGLVGGSGSPSYGASKHGVVGLTRNAAVQYSASGIRVNAVCPGYVRTPMTEGMLANPANLERVTARHPLGRLGTPEDIAESVVWLCSDAASFVTGHTMTVDGGYVAQ